MALQIDWFSAVRYFFKHEAEKKMLGKKLNYI